MNPSAALLRWFAASVQAVTMSCKKAAKLQSQAIHRPLSRSERIGLKVHLALCGWCRRYGKAISFLCAAADHHFQDAHLPAPGCLSPEARGRIRRRLQTTPASATTCEMTILQKAVLVPRNSPDRLSNDEILAEDSSG